MKSTVLGGFALRKLVWLSVIVVLFAATSAQASHGGIHPTFRSETVYFHCNGPTKLYSLHNHYVPWRVPVPWNTTPPAQSYKQGAGCVALDTSLSHDSNNNEYDVTFGGDFTGNLRDLTVRVHGLLVGSPLVKDQLRVRLQIDGEHYLPLGVGNIGTYVDVTPVPSSDGITQLIEFSITDIGSANEDGDGTTKHQVIVHVTTTNLPDTGVYIWDASEFASGITFNPATLANSKVKATPPR